MASPQEPAPPLIRSGALCDSAPAIDGPVSFGAPARALFSFDPSYRPLNHGSYGAVPRAVFEARLQAMRDEEARPDIYRRWTYAPRLRAARAAVAPLLGARPDDVVLVVNATTAVNTVLRNLRFESDDAVLFFSCIYGALRNTVLALSETGPVCEWCVPLDLPLEYDEIVARFRAGVAEARAAGKTVRVAIFDAVVSQPGVKMPWERLVDECKNEGILSLVDAAHGVGLIPLEHTATVDPDFFVSNCHKWLYVPRGCAVLYVPARNHPLINTSLPTSWGYKPPAARDKMANPSAYFADLFVDLATADSSAYTCVSAALAFRRDRCGGEAAIRDYCTRLANDAADRVAAMLGTEVMSDRAGHLRACALVNVRLPLAIRIDDETDDDYDQACHASDDNAGRGWDLHKHDAQVVFDWIKQCMADDYDTFVSIFYHRGAFWIRLCGQIYLTMEDIEWGGRMMLEICERVKRGEWKKDG